MCRVVPIQTGSLRSFAGWVALCFFILGQLHPALFMVSVLLADAHGHTHEVVVRTDGGHVDLVLAHRASPTPAAHEQASSGSSRTVFCATHDHDGDAHVLHFNKRQAEQRPSRGLVALSPFSSAMLPAAGVVRTAVEFSAVKPAASFAARPPPSLFSIRTTVLLI